MPTIQPEFLAPIAKERKRMLEVQQLEAGRVRVYINFSSLDILQTCPRKAQFRLLRGLEKNEGSPAQLTGSGVHKALETWYRAPRNLRRRSDYRSDEALSLLLSGGALHNNVFEDPRISALSAYLQEAEPLRSRPDLGARDPSRVVEILNGYFDEYLEDPYEVAALPDGKLMIEQNFELPIYEGNFLWRGEPVKLEVVFFGTIDVVLKDVNSGEILICDHKTTSSLGTDFFNRIKPNFQYTGYWLAARDVFGLNPKRVMVNGIQIAKTKNENKRQFVYVTDEEVHELKCALVYHAKNFLNFQYNGYFPMSTPGACSTYGGCQYKNICEVPSGLRESLIEAEYTNGEQVSSSS